MHRFLWFTMFAVLLTAAGCSVVLGSGENTPPEITGLIFSVDGNKILVVKGIENANIPYDEWFEAGHRAIYFTITGSTEIRYSGKKVSMEKLEKGQKVQVWAEGPLMESYPEQGEARKIVIMGN